MSDQRSFGMLKIIPTKITGIRVNYDASTMVPATTVVVETELHDELNLAFHLSFRFHGKDHVHEWQLLQLLAFCKVKRASELVGKEIKLYLNDRNDIAGYGKMQDNIFILYRDEKNKKYYFYT